MLFELLVIALLNCLKRNFLRVRNNFMNNYTNRNKIKMKKIKLVSYFLHWKIVFALL